MSFGGSPGSPPPLQIPPPSDSVIDPDTDATLRKRRALARARRASTNNFRVESGSAVIPQTTASTTNPATATGISIPV